jgi:hypothetical protein
MGVGDRLSTQSLIEITAAANTTIATQRPRRYDAATPVRPPNLPQRAPLH